MALSNAQVTQILDSIAKVLTDFNTSFITNTGTNAPTASTITTGISGTGASQTLGRVINWLDASSEENMLVKMQNTANGFVSYINAIRSLPPVYQQFYSILDALDATLVGLNAFLTAQSIQINALVAAAFNAYVAASVSGAFRSIAPPVISPANFFPYALLDDMWDFTCSGATTFSTNAVGPTNTSTALAGGGVAQFYLYKVNAVNAVGGAAISVTYLDGAGVAHTVVYNTTSGVPLASGSLAAGYAIPGAIGTAITAVTGTGMTSAEQYRIGQQLVRAASY
jgi:hypothetical protein